jgi:hypothetical protein
MDKREKGQTRDITNKQRRKNNSITEYVRVPVVGCGGGVEHGHGRRELLGVAAE